MNVFNSTENIFQGKKRKGESGQNPKWKLKDNQRRRTNRSNNIHSIMSLTLQNKLKKKQALV